MKKCFLLGVVSYFLFACTKSDNFQPIETSQSEVSLKLSQNQAKVYASLFLSYLEDNGVPMKLRAKKNNNHTKELEKIDYLVENGDTLLYALNYKNNEGFILLAGSNGSFPILAHSDKGNLYFKEIDKESPLQLVIENSKNKVKQMLENPTNLNLEYYENWKDLGNKDYEYKIEISPEPIADENNGLSKLSERRDYSSGKTSIYPYTGKALDKWGQYGEYNFYSKNNAAIGCPAVSIGMLMYDTSNRLNGRMIYTYPNFDIYSSSVNNAKYVSKSFRQIADSIPNYSWGKSKGATSGANLIEIKQGLRKLGYTKADFVPFNIDVLYNNLQFKGSNYFGQETTFYNGVLIAGIQNPYSREGHIWFCDGYYEQSYTVTKRFLGIRVRRWTEYEDKLYMNWGWNDGSNGWYHAEGFDWKQEGEKNNTRNLNYATQIIINLHHYENPLYNRRHNY